MLCVGLDTDVERRPHRSVTILTRSLRSTSTSSTRPRVCRRLQANIAFYEGRGEIGLRELRMTVDYLREHYPDILTICDAKRGDSAPLTMVCARHF